MSILSSEPLRFCSIEPKWRMNNRMSKAQIGASGREKREGFAGKGLSTYVFDNAFPEREFRGFREL